MLGGLVDGANRRSREWQRDQLRRTGFATAQPETGHSVALALRELGYSPTVAQVAGQLAAVPGAYNWQGNTRIAQIIGRHKRTVQRARAKLEAAGLLRSELLLTGDMLDGQRAPVRHPQVVRDVSALQRLANVRESMRSSNPPERRKRRRKGPSAAETPVEPQQPMTAADYAALGEAHPEFAAFFSGMAAAQQRRPQRPPPNAPPKIDPKELDDFDAETERLERERRQRGPPERAPPERR